MILFFIHRFNDIDHLTPVIYKVAKESEEDVLVLAINPFVNIHNDFRIEFLDQLPNIHIDYLINYFKPSIFYKILAYLMARPYLNHSLYENNKLLQKAIKKRDLKNIYFCLSRLFSGSSRRVIAKLNLYQKIIRNFYGNSYAKDFISEVSPSLIIFDHASTSPKRNAISDTPPIKWIIDQAKSLSIKIVSLPHGVPLFYKSPDVYDERKKWVAQDKADYLVLQHKWWMNECIEFGLDEKKAFLLGLPRFSKEWTEILHRIVPKNERNLYEGTEKIKVVYMDTGPDNYKDRKDYAQEMLDVLSRLDYVNLIYKPHTRSNKNHLVINEFIEDGMDVNSVNLVKWSDVVIGMHSSIMIEALIQNKVYISPKYFRDFELLFEKYKACFIAHSLNDIVSALEQIKEDRKKELYSKKHVNDFLIDVVNNGDPTADILMNYKDFILDCCK